MATKQEFAAEMTAGYRASGELIELGAAMFNGEVLPDAPIALPLRTLNRHGLIAGATGTGKTKTLGLIAEGLSEAGVPVVLMDIKGDLSGLAKPGEANPQITERMGKVGCDWSPGGYPVEFLTLSNDAGVRMRATVHEFGPVLFSKMLGLNETQSSLVSLVFKFCDDKKLPLLDLKDFRKVLDYITGDAKDNVTQEYGLVPVTTVSLIQRKLIELEQQGASLFFGEKSFEVVDLMRTVNGFGMISILRLTDIQDRPKLFSSFMLQLLAEIYATLPEAGDLPKPKVVMFIDEAHLLFDEAENALLEQIEQIIKLIRSKGVGVFFCTQSSGDIPDAVLSQLGMKIQHALRAFTAKDRKAIKLIAQNFPESEFYDIEAMLTSMGIGEALVTALNENGTPTPLAATLMAAPRSRMGVLTADELEGIVAASALATKYNTPVDIQSAYEILGGKIAVASTPEHAERVTVLRRTFVPPVATASESDSANVAQSHPDAALTEALGGNAAMPYPTPPAVSANQPGIFANFINSPITQQVARQAARTLTATVTGAVTRSLLGVVGLGGRRR